MMEVSRECTGCMNVEISKTRLTELRRKADLAQSLADALEECIDALCNTEDWQHGMDQHSKAVTQAETALAQFKAQEE